MAATATRPASRSLCRLKTSNHAPYPAKAPIGATIAVVKAGARVKPTPKQQNQAARK
jgi:hypothetical protein